MIPSSGTGTPLPLLNGVASVGTSNPVANFIQGLPTKADQGFDFANTPFSSADVRGNVLLLEAGSPSGVAFSNVSGAGVTGNKNYAGLLPGTNLGAPITDTSTSAIWDAKIEASFANRPYSNPDFKMQVTFNNSGGTINSGTVSGGTFTPEAISVPFILNGTSFIGHTFNIQGRFGSDGLLYGTVVRDNTATGTLTGLIGSGGAVGAFVDTNSPSGFAGGFVAKPPE